MDRLHAMRVFARVVDEGSLIGAARSMHLSAAAVTRTLAELEDHLGARLLNRTTRRLALTEVGELYLERVRRIVTDVEDAEAMAGAATSRPQGHVRVLVPPALAVHQLAKHLPRFRALYPGVTLELSVPGPVETVDENFDVTLIAVTHGLPAGDFVARRLASSEVVVCASPEYLEQRGRPLHPHDLLGHDAMVPPFARELSFVRGPFRADGSGAEVVRLPVRRAALSTGHIDTLYASALAGLGVAGLPSFVIEDALVEQALERLLPEWRLVTFGVYAAMPTRKHVPARTRAFIDFLVQIFGGENRDPWLAAAGCVTHVP